MKTYLIPKKSGSSGYFHFRGFIPKDLIDHFDGKREFQISLKNVSNSRSLIVSLVLKHILQELFDNIRTGMKSLGLEEIKEILRVEVKKSILHAHHVHLGTNEFNSLKVEKSLDSVSLREQKFKEDIAQDLNGYEKELDQKLEGILKSLEIDFDIKSVIYKRLRRSFVKLYLLRYDWIKDLINETGRVDDDFRREVDDKLKMNLFPDLEIPPSVQIQVGDQILNPVIENLTPEPPQPYRVERPQSSHQSIKISEGIEKYLDDKTDDDLRSKTSSEIKYSLSLLI